MSYVESGPSVTVYRTVYSWDRFYEGDRGEPVSESEEVFYVDNWRDDHGDWDEGEMSWVPASRVLVASFMLNGTHTGFWQSESSSSPGEVWCGDNPVYMSEVEELYDGTYVESSARLSGFGPGEVAEVYALCCE